MTILTVLIRVKDCRGSEPSDIFFLFIQHYFLVCLENKDALTHPG